MRHYPLLLTPAFSVPAAARDRYAAERSSYRHGDLKFDADDRLLVTDLARHDLH